MSRRRGGLARLEAGFTAVGTGVVMCGGVGQVCPAPDEFLGGAVEGRCDEATGCAGGFSRHHFSSSSEPAEPVGTR